jgi:hypothetical protein
MNTPKALANFSPGFEHRENPGGNNSNGDQTLKGFIPRRTLSGFKRFLLMEIPGLSLRSNPGLKLANAFGVFD